MAQHKYDEFYRLLCDAKVVTARAVREAEALGLKGTLDEITDLYNGLGKIANNVMAKIEADHIASLIDNSGAPPLTAAPGKRKMGDDSWQRAAVHPQFNYLHVTTPAMMYTHVHEERHHHHASTDCSTQADGPAETPADPGSCPTD